jgi:hypothetical protein
MAVSYATNPGATKPRVVAGPFAGLLWLPDPVSVVHKVVSVVVTVIPRRGRKAVQTAAVVGGARGGADCPTLHIEREARRARTTTAGRQRSLAGLGESC